MVPLFLLAQIAATPQLRPPPKRPNVLIVVADDVGVDQLGCYSQAYADLELQPCSPRIDQLASMGVRFTNAWSSPGCSPSRAMILTGLPPRASGVGNVTDWALTDNVENGVQPTEISLASAAPGYTTVALGKWHVSDPLQEMAGIQSPIALGFGGYAGSLYNLQLQYDDWIKTTYPSGVQIPNYTVYATNDTTNDALAAIASLPEPWLLYVAFNAAHDPLHCPADKGYVSPQTGLPDCKTNWLATCPNGNDGVTCSNEGLDPCQSRALVQTLDESVGSLLDAIDMSRTAVLFVSDNGSAKRPTVPPFEREHSKGTIYQGGVSVPMIVYVPGGYHGDCGALVSLTDLFATVSDLTLASIPPDPRRDSVSLMQYVAPWANRSHAKPRANLFIEQFGPNYMPDANGPPPSYVAEFNTRAIRNGTHKLIEFRSWQESLQTCFVRFEFYHLAFFPGQEPALGPDPFELDDLMLHPASWTAEDSEAFDTLSAALLTETGPLVVGQCH